MLMNAFPSRLRVLAESCLQPLLEADALISQKGQDLPPLKAGKMDPDSEALKMMEEN